MVWDVERDEMKSEDGKGGVVWTEARVGYGYENENWDRLSVMEK